jgi:hypothetical protein
MFDLRRATVIGVLLTVVALAAAACGGSTAATPVPTPTPASGTEATPTPASGSEATPTPATEGTPVAALPTFDLGALTGGIPGLDSYRTETSSGGVKQYESVVVKNPVLSKAITIFDESGDVTTRLIVIGDEAWSADGANGAFKPVPSQLASSMLMVYDPAIMLGGFAAVDWANAASNLGTEQKNGIQAHHVRIDSTSFVGAAAAMPPGAAIDAWVADAGYLVAWEMTGFPGDANFSIQVTGVNDPANKVERPS